MITLRRLAAALPLALVPAACTTSRQLLLGDADGTTRAAVEAAWRGHIAGAQRRDLDAVMAMYADDAVYAVDGAPPLVGRAAIRAMEERGLALGEVVRARHAIDALRAAGNVAYELATVDGEVAPHGAAPQRVVFHFVGVWRRDDDGRWRLCHLAGRTAAAPSEAVGELPGHTGS